MEISAKTLVGEIVRNYPECIDVLLNIGMHCLGCPASQMESLEDACMVHNNDVNELLKELNEFFAAKAGN